MRKLSVRRLIWPSCGGQRFANALHQNASKATNMHAHEGWLGLHERTTATTFASRSHHGFRTVRVAQALLISIPCWHIKSLMVATVLIYLAHIRLRMAGSLRWFHEFLVSFFFFLIDNKYLFTHHIHSGRILGGSSAINYSMVLDSILPNLIILTLYILKMLNGKRGLAFSAEQSGHEF